MVKLPKLEKPEEGTVTLILLWLTLGIATIVLLFMSENPNNTYSLPLLVIFGVIDLLAVLTIAGKIFSSLNLACKDEALGLPAGSIRALIALSLIIIFAIMAIFMYNQLTPTSLLQIPANQTIIYPNGTLIQNPNGTVLLAEPSQAQREFSMQTLTTVSTLVVALAGFYFGTKAVAMAKGVEEKEPEYSLTIKPEGEVEYQKKPISIKVETEPKGEKFKFKIDGDDRESVKIGDVSNELTYEPSEKRTKNVVTLTFTLEQKPVVSKKLSVVIEKLEVTAKPDGKIKVGEVMNIEVKTTPANANVESSVHGDKKASLPKLANGKTTYTPSPKGPDRPEDTVLLMFELDGKPKIVEYKKVEIEP